jgi:hypothetical protein
VLLKLKILNLMAVTLVLHTWGSALTHHPHVHGIVPGGGLSLDGERWISCKPGFFLSVRVLSRLFRRRFLEELSKAHAAGQLQFFGEYAHLSDSSAFADWLAPLKKCEWVVYAKRPFAGPEAVLAYLSRYTHRVAIANSRLITLDERGVTFRWKDYRAKGKTRHKTMTLTTDEFIRRFLLHALPSGFHRIRHYGLLANAGRHDNLARVRDLLQVAPANTEPMNADADALDKAIQPTFVCPDCGAAMIIVEILARKPYIRAPPPAGRCAMSTHTWQTPNYLSFIYRLEPIREGLAWRQKIPDSAPLGQRKIGNIAIKPERLSYIIAQPMGLQARFKADPPFKSP